MTQQDTVRREVSVDLDVCEASGVCARMVREVFRLDDDDVLTIAHQPDTDELDRRVAVAVRRCPKQALSLH
ncbi:ferredoxin [Nocardioides soli]|jgi:ferredoxin|uniref:Ferredoxin n=1 Tax=Nocardioides soli TaxID=1036020 RepID=A0A7W4Z3Y2_9ACTN|nr:ferredoxin [Nocardioides soli]MBB3044180.1 ferredoxin [Nocardioides soli]